MYLGQPEDRASIMAGNSTPTDQPQRDSPSVDGTKPVKSMENRRVEQNTQKP